MCRGVAQLVARVLWEHDAAGSSPVAPTKRSAIAATSYSGTADRTKNGGIAQLVRVLA